MLATVLPSNVQGTITAPASKSAMQRACAAALLRKGSTILINPGHSADDEAALDIIRQLGAQVEKKDGEVLIISHGLSPVSNRIHCGESGLSVRMFTSIASLSKDPIEVTGSGSLLRRPLHFFQDVLPELGVEVSSQNGLLPLKIKGPLIPRDIEIDGSLSSQFLTGLLFAYAAAGASDVQIRVKNLNSKPYIDLTLQVMTAFGLHTPVNHRYEEFYFDKQVIGKQDTAPFRFAVESDWSGGAFLLVAGAIGGEVLVKGLDLFSTQADRAILQALRMSGAMLGIHENQIRVKRSALTSFQFNATDCPDLFPPLVALAAACEGTSVIEGVHRLAHKESDRGSTLQEEFGKMGINVRLEDDRMYVEGGQVKGAMVQSHHDHRIAMACAVAGLRASGPVEIHGAEAVNKSYPQFWNHMQELRAGVSLKND